MSHTDLQDHPLLAPLRPDERATVLAAAELRDLPAGAPLLVQGQTTTGLHLVLDGRVTVEVEVDGTRHDVAALEAGTVVGELSFLDDDPVSAAHVRTVEPTRVATLPTSDWARLREVDAFTLQLDAIARRRRATNRTLSIPPVVAGEVAGRPLTLRPLWPEDWRQLAEGTDRVSERSLHLRFFHVPPLTERTFRRLTTVNLHDQFAWGAFVDGRLGGVGRHALQAEDRGVAELALLVVDDLQGRGVGSRLVAAIAAAADAHGADELSAVARAENHAVRGLLERYGAVWRGAEEDGVVTARWALSTALRQVTDDQLVERARTVAAMVLADVVDP